MNNFGVGYAEDLKNGCNSHGEAIILNPSRRDTTIIHYSFKFQIARQSDKSEFYTLGDKKRHPPVGRCRSGYVADQSIFSIRP